MAKGSLLITWHWNLYSLRQDLASRSSQPITKPPLAPVYTGALGYTVQVTLFPCVTQAKQAGAGCLERGWHGWRPLRILTLPAFCPYKSALRTKTKKSVTWGMRMQQPCSWGENNRLNKHLKHYSSLLFCSDFRLEYTCYLVQKVEETDVHREGGQFSLTLNQPKLGKVALVLSQTISFLPQDFKASVLLSTLPSSLTQQHLVDSVLQDSLARRGDSAITTIASPRLG